MARLPNLAKQDVTCLWFNVLLYHNEVAEQNGERRKV